MKYFKSNYIAGAALSISALLGSTALATAQEAANGSFTIGGMEVSSSYADGILTDTLSDNTLLSPSRHWRTTLDDKGRVTSIDGPQEGDDDTVTISYENNGATKVVTNAAGHVSRFEYNDAGILTTVIDPNGDTTSITYYPETGQINQHIASAGTEAQSITRFTYGADGKITSVTLPTGRVITKIFDETGQLTSKVSSALNTVKTTLLSDRLQNYVVKVPGRGGQFYPNMLSPKNTTEHILDDQGRIVSGLDANGKRTSFAYDDFGNVASVTDARGVVTSYSYNGFRELIREVSAERGETSYKYDSAGNVVREKRAGDVVIMRSYDNLNRITKEVFREQGAERKVTRYSYDDCVSGIGRLCSVTMDGITTSYSYTPQGRYARIKTRDKDGRVETTRYGYGVYGRLENLRYPTGLNIRYRYNQDGYIKKVTGRYETGEGQETFVIAKDIQIDPETQTLGALTFGNGLTTTLLYGANNLGNLSSITTEKRGIQIDSTSYSLDEYGLITGITRLIPEQSKSYSYDALGRLTAEQTGGGIATSYTYDEVGNRTRLDGDSKSKRYTYAQNSNRLAKIGRKTLNYDIRGNLLQDGLARKSYSYNAANRMDGFYKDGELTASFRYNSEGQRIEKVLHRPKRADDSYRSLRFSYLPGGQLLSEHGIDSEKRATFARDYVWIGATPIAQVQRKIKPSGIARKAKITYIHTDHLGAPQTASDASGQMVWRWDRDAFGNGKANRDVDGDGKKTVIRLRFPGQYYDRESSLFYNHNRDYDPKLGRYIQSDPIGLLGGINRYGYVSGNPVNLIDPNGLAEICYSTQHGYNESGAASDSGGSGRDSGPVRAGTFISRETRTCIYIPDTPLPGIPYSPPTPIPTPPPAPVPTSDPEPEPPKDGCSEAADLIADLLRQALADPRSVTIELGGVVYSLNGVLGHSWAPPGTGIGVNIFDAPVPAGATVLYGFHTHPQGTGAFFSGDDYAIANPEWVRGIYSSGSPSSFLGLGLGFTRNGNAQQFLLRNNAANANDVMFQSAEIMALADEITGCGK